MITALFITIYFVIALSCVGLGWYLSYPGHTMFTLPSDALSVFHRRSRPASTVKDEMFTSVHYVSPVQPAPVDAAHAETQYHLATPAVTSTIEEDHSETEPAEAVHDEP